jgi:hypothetical protein
MFFQKRKECEKAKLNLRQPFNQGFPDSCPINRGQVVIKLSRLGEYPIYGVRYGAFYKRFVIFDNFNKVIADVDELRRQVVKDRPAKRRCRLLKSELRQRRAPS